MITEDKQVVIYDVDVNKIMKPSAALQFTQSAGDAQMKGENFPYVKFHDMGLAFMLSRLDMNILEEIKDGDVVTSASWPCPSRRATFLRNYFSWLGDKKVIEVSTQWTLVNLEDRKILTVDDIDLSSYTHRDYTEVAAGKLKIGSDVELELMGEKKISYSDADYNGHMNNTYYLDVLCDHIPELEAATHRVSTVRIHYSKEAVVGETIKIYRSGLLEPREGAIHEGRYLFKTERMSDGAMNVACEIGLTKVK